MGDKIIEQESTVKVLGVIISQNERYKEYLVNSKKSMMKFLNTRHSMLKMLSKYADLKSRKALAEGLILSKLNYCISLWGTTTAGIMQQIQVLLNDVVRTVFGVGRGRFTELDPLYKKLKWLKLTQTLQYHDTISLHSMLKNNTPQDIAKKFKPDIIPTHNTRASRKAFRRNPETTSRNTLKQAGFVCRAARLYEELPELVTESIFLPKWAFKDFARSRLGGRQTKEETWNVMTYLEELKKAGKNF